MAKPNSRDTLLDYCLRRLGAPVIDINVDPDQLEDKLDDALQLYQEFHSDATMRTYLTHEITQADLDNDYIPVADGVLYVTRVFPRVNALSGTRNMFDVRYQTALNDLRNVHNYMSNLAMYDQMMQYMSLLDMKLNGQPLVQYSRHRNELHIFGDMNDNNTNNYAIGDFVVYEAFVIIDPTTYTSVFNDMWVKDYTTSLIKQQWGSNMSKFEGMVLPGGVQFNGRQYYDDATNELEQLRERLRLEQEMPVDFFVG